MGFRGMLNVIAAAAITAGGSACSSSTAPTTPVDLSGTYILQSISIGGQAVPNSSGTFTLTKTTYDLFLTLGGQVLPEDIGTYTATGNNWSQTSNTTSTQAVGTYTLSGNVLTVTVTSPAPGSVSVWQKQSTP
ncbi:MAG: hypothetical protein ACM3NS_11425 [Deltaproteobacteria bacterium]